MTVPPSSAIVRSMSLKALSAELAPLVGGPVGPAALTSAAAEQLTGLLAEPFVFLRRLNEPVRIIGGSIPGEEQISIRPAAAQRWYDRGHTLYVMRADTRHELLRKQLLALGELVPHDFGSVGVFVSPAGAVYEWHFDQYDNITVQIASTRCSLRSRRGS